MQCSQPTGTKWLRLLLGMFMPSGNKSMVKVSSCLQFGHNKRTNRCAIDRFSVLATK